MGLLNNDLISRSALLADIEDTVVISARNTKSAEMRGIHKVVDRIKATPAVDAVEVVRCEKCQHYNKQYKSETEKCCTINAEYDPDVGVWYGFTAYPPPDFYCADGERRADGT